MQRNLEDRSFLLLLLAVTFGFGLLILPFFYAIFWAAMLAILFAPLHRWLIRRFPGRDNVSALLTLLASVLIVVIPLAVMMTMLAKEGARVYQQVSSGEIQLQVLVDKARAAMPVIQELAERFEIDLGNVKQMLSQAALTGSKFFATQAFNFGQEYLQFTVSFVLMLYLTFFFLRDGSSLIQLLIRALPLGDTREIHLFQKFAEVSRATVKGNLVVAMVQGSLGGLIFWALGIKGALLWGVVMVVLSLLPAVGSALVWGPAAAYLFFSGDVFKGVVLVLFGFFVIGLVDNVLRPVLVGRDTKMPDYLVLLSTLGGLSLFGLNGFVLGPVLTALFLAFWQIFMEEFNNGEEETFVDEDEASGV
ncbi:AI-2E family transporter [Hahella sp. HN01]|uniref:AI-2E family transporter n=1 Tax=unclassified Hahella TaxID=2624107 RepID=UPI001C1E91A7|nr:AI-2E family transporter [Hahella sp. HN01]MBU6955072.1 AI-2E family transporter [Hahella sp. HN01]